MNHLKPLPRLWKPPELLTFSVLLGLLCTLGLGCGDFAAAPPGDSSPGWPSQAERSATSSSSPEGQWSTTGSMVQGRLLHTATLLGDGRVLAMGGYNRSSELYEPASGTWSRTADALNTHRAATATLLSNGRVLIAGVGGAEWNSGTSSEVYDPASGSWAPSGNLVTPRLYHTATLLPGGRVLVTGGADSEYGGGVLSSAEVYDPATGTWTGTGRMAVSRRNHTATLLSNGRVLVSGGTDGSGQLQSSAEVYDVATGSWSPVSGMAVPRAYHSATLLSDGKVLVAGGGGSSSEGSRSVELFDPGTGTWAMSASMAQPRRSHSASLLPSGQVLVAGGFHEYTGILSTAEVYDPALGAWHSAGAMGTGRYQHTATLMTGGRVLVAGGFSTGNQASAEVYKPAGSTEPEQPTEPAGTSVLLRVVDEEGNPVAGAAVSSQGAVFPVDSSGHLLLENLPSGRFLARVDALGFTSGTAVVELEAGAHVGAQVKLLLLPAPIPFQAEQGGVIQTEQVRVTLPPNAVVDALGQPVSGTVEVTITPIDPTTQLEAMPGPLEGMTAATSEQVQLESYFMAEVSLWSQGAPVQLAPGKSASVEFVLPEALASQFEAGDSVPAWWFDLDAGHWREEGAGTIQPSQTQPGKLAWVVQVKHFTWWNCDAPWTDKSCVNVFVVDEQGVPVRGAAVNAEGISYTGSSGRSYTGADGRTCVEIKRGNTAKVYAGLAGQPVTAVVTVTGTQSAAICGSGPCVEVQLIQPEVICTPGAYEPCPYSGPAGTEGQGLCRAGRRGCNVHGTEWSACRGEVLPAAESCQSPFDDDCDGGVNEGCSCSDVQGMPCYGGASWTRGVGICHAGTVACDLFGNAVCQGQQLPQPENCSTPADEDCNGASESCGPVSWGWSLTGQLATARSGHTATLLPNGQVLVAGGAYSSGSDNSSAEVYNPATGTWSVVDSMFLPRRRHTATLLPNGQVLVTGGLSGSGYLSSAEVYDPVSRTWSLVGSMALARIAHTATLLPNGQVLIAGGVNGTGSLSSAEVYDPATGTWSSAGSMTSIRSEHTATLLPNGEVLVSGGYGGNTILASAEVYTPATNTWSVVGAMEIPRARHTATLLLNGQVLVAGGGDYSYLPRSVAIYDPSSRTWTVVASMTYARMDAAATLLPDGQVLVTGRATWDQPHLTFSELYNPTLGTWSAAAPSEYGYRYVHTATLLPNGHVLVVGGTSDPPELYGPISGFWSTTGSMSSPSFFHTATVLPNGQLLVAGGLMRNSDPYSPLSRAEVYDVATGLWSETGAMDSPRAFHTATLLPNDQVLVTGGNADGTNTVPLSSAELYAPSLGTWRTTSPMASVRADHTATLLPNGQVLVTGGRDGTSNALASAEVYDPATGTWSTVSSMTTPRRYHRAVLLPSGQVLVTGGESTSSNALASSEIYDPATSSWSIGPSMASARWSHTATLLPNGRVLVVGSGSAEVYDPMTNTWSATNTPAAFSWHAATLLPNGRVLVSGGVGPPRAKTEVYNPSSGTWSAAGTMASARYIHTATVLPNGRVLVIGGLDLASQVQATAELYTP